MGTDEDSATGSEPPPADHGNAPQKEPDTLPSPDAAATGSDDEPTDHDSRAG